MKRFSYRKPDGGILRLVLTDKQLENEIYKKALEEWAKQWELFSTGEDTKIRQDPMGQIVFSDDVLFWNGEKWKIKYDRGWIAYLGDKELPLIPLINEVFIIEP